jgi:hypothetical protein
MIVDQFEELLTETAEAPRLRFVDLLMALTALGGFRIVLTVRADHFNLCRPLTALFDHPGITRTPCCGYGGSPTPALPRPSANPCAWRVIATPPNRMR